MFSELKRDIWLKWNSGQAYIRLIIIQVAVFVGIMAISAIAYFMNQYDSLNLFFRNFLFLNSNLSVLVWRPWTIFSHFFVHLDLFHLLSNLLLLNFAGSLLNYRLKNQTFLKLYLLSGLAGGILYVIAENIMVSASSSFHYSVALGSSACVMGVLMTATVLNPGMVVNLILVGRVKLLYVTLFLLAVDFIYLYSSNFGGHIAHIGGAAFGWWFASSMAVGKEPFLFLNSMEKWFSPPKMKVSHRRPLSDEEYNAKRKATQEEIDAILDKISRSGYDSLSKSEKETLFKASGKS